MDGAGAKFVKGFYMNWVVVAEMFVESVAGIDVIGFDHEPIAGDFCEDGGGGDGGVF